DRCRRSYYIQSTRNVGSRNSCGPRSGRKRRVEIRGCRLRRPRDLQYWSKLQGTGGCWGMRGTVSTHNRQEIGIGASALLGVFLGLAMLVGSIWFSESQLKAGLLTASLFWALTTS